MSQEDKEKITDPWIKRFREILDMEDRDKKRSQFHGSWGSWISRRARQVKHTTPQPTTPLDTTPDTSPQGQGEDHRSMDQEIQGDLEHGGQGQEKITVPWCVGFMDIKKGKTGKRSQIRGALAS